MRTVTVDEFVKLITWYDYPRERIEELSGGKPMTALDVLRLDIPDQDRLYAVLREEFIDTEILHEFACWCAEEALKLMPKKYPHCIAAIDAKRAWIRGEISDRQLDAARAALLKVANSAVDTEWCLMMSCAFAASITAMNASVASVYAASVTLRSAALAAQIEYLIRVLEGSEDNDD